MLTIPREYRVGPQLVLVRHCASVHNLNQILEGSLDSGLSPFGFQQARAIARVLKPVELSTICSSPARRAVETARAIAESRCIDYSVVEELRERDFGPFEGLTRSELLERRALFGASNIDPTQDWRGIPGVESDAEICARVRPLLQHFLSSYPHVVAVVTHAGVIKSILHAIFQIPESRVACFKIPNGCMVGLRPLVDSNLEMAYLLPASHAVVGGPKADAVGRPRTAAN